VVGLDSDAYTIHKNETAWVTDSIELKAGGQLPAGGWDQKLSAHNERCGNRMHAALSELHVLPPSDTDPSRAGIISHDRDISTRHESERLQVDDRGIDSGGAKIIQRQNLAGEEEQMAIMTSEQRQMLRLQITAFKYLSKSLPLPPDMLPRLFGSQEVSKADTSDRTVNDDENPKCVNCDTNNTESTDTMVFCEGCRWTVHQECYGVPFIPEGQWLCRKCQLMGSSAPTCIFCPNIDGAFKQTNNIRWAHVLCAIWIPEVSMANEMFMEPV
jgi:hypothetical protein